MFRPLMRYAGGKNAPGTFHRLISWMPPHAVYVEPFLGSGALMRMKRPAPINLGIDAAGDVVESFQAAAAADLGPIRIDLEKAAYRLAIAPHAISGVARARFFVAVGDGITFLETSNGYLDERALVYCDPPYMWSTRTGRQCYEHELSDSEHERLLAWIVTAKCRVMISGYWSKVYASTLRKWRCVSFPAMTRGGRLKQECVWMNFPEPGELHDYQFLGKDWRERQRIRRRQARWRAKLEAMPMFERMAMLEAVDQWRAAQSRLGSHSTKSSG